ncbi:CRISPR-associated protein Cas4 [Caryophanon latum]|uniref:CRISPR-associated exonuclease Cas4 n=1 Tax=Caryophanon latum TaxID=33977 RepID=A0A1C0YQ14_9BACL|nr:CRISPR-associated protein Cas4 [Caryophanon latum]OCS89255.1 CRISPR-associated protein Cas4 [Caryophanon latum]
MHSIGGLHIQYYEVCKRKLWLYSKQIGFETEHERVIEGTLLHESSYARKEKELAIDEAVIDVIDGEFVQETKLSSKMQRVDEWQLLYYLYLLKQKGIEKRGKIAYTKEKKVVEVTLTEEKERQLKRKIADIHSILKSQFAPKFKKLPYCKSCAYFDFCFITEEDADAT